jgi:hypothetical protein
VVRVVLGLTVLLALAGPVGAERVCFEKDFDQFGKVFNNAVPGICAAVANINSFVYLRNHFAQHYAATDIIPDWNGDGVVDFQDYEDSRDKMAYGWEHGGNTRTGIYGGGMAGDIWAATYYWFEDFAPGTTVLDGQVSTSSNMRLWPGWDVLERKYPEWSFLWDELVACRDVELGIRPISGGIGHALTLTGLAFDDLDADGMWDYDESPLAIGYLDPNDVSAQKWADVTYGLGSRLEFWWPAKPDNPNDPNDPNKQYYIYRAYTEGPTAIPEPSVLVLLLGVVVAGMIRKVRGPRHC